MVTGLQSDSICIIMIFFFFYTQQCKTAHLQTSAEAMLIMLSFVFISSLWKLEHLYVCEIGK